jgi:hypothetical protein
MKEQLITFETAKLAKEKGFNVPTFVHYTEYLVNKIDEEYPNGGGPFSMTKGEIVLSNSYHKNNDKNGDFSNENYYSCAASTQSLLQKWIREKHDIHVEPFEENKKYVLLIHYYSSVGCRIEDWTKKGPYDSYEDALEVGLKMALNINK